MAISQDELVLTIFAAAVSFIYWLLWYIKILGKISYSSSRAGRALLSLAPIISLAALFVILRNFASFDVKDNPFYLSMYCFIGGVCTAIMTEILSGFGLSYQFDAIERNNAAAAAAIFGVVIAFCLCYAGGNIGDGPGWYVVIFCAALSSGTLLLILAILFTFTNLLDILTIDRDIATGIRIASFLLSLSLLFGRAVAGDWISAEQTVIDFYSIAWVGVFFIIIEIILLSIYKPTPSEPKLSVFLYGIIPAVIYLAASVYYIRAAGYWDTLLKIAK